LKLCQFSTLRFFSLCYITILCSYFKRKLFVEWVGNTLTLECRVGRVWLLLCQKKSKIECVTCQWSNNVGGQPGLRPRAPLQKVKKIQYKGAQKKFKRRQILFTGRKFLVFSPGDKTTCPVTVTCHVSDSVSARVKPLWPKGNAIEQTPVTPRYVGV